MASAVRQPILIGNRTYECSALDDNARESLDNWVRERYYEIAASMFEKITKADIREQAMAVAMKEALTLTWMSGEGARLIASVDGMARIFWESIRKNHPDVTYESLREQMMNPDNIRKMNRVFKQLNTDKVKANAGDPKKSLATRKKRLTRKKKSG